MDLTTLFIIFTVASALFTVFIAAVFNKVIEPPQKLSKENEDLVGIINEGALKLKVFETELEMKTWEKALQNRDLDLMRFLLEQIQKRNPQLQPFPKLNLLQPEFDLRLKKLR